jgi:hypothetical protein
MKEESINFIVHVMGFMLIYSAVNYNREVSIKLFSKTWWPVILMVSIGGALVQFSI